MEAQIVLSVLLLVLAACVWLRPRWISTFRGYTEEQFRKVDLKRVRRTAGGGLTLLALLLGGGSWALHRAGVDYTTLTVLGIVLTFAGVVAIMARVETFDRNR